MAAQPFACISNNRQPRGQYRSFIVYCMFSYPFHVLQNLQVILTSSVLFFILFFMGCLDNVIEQSCFILCTIGPIQYMNNNNKSFSNGCWFLLVTLGGTA